MREILKTCWVNTVAAEAYLNIDFPTKNDGWDFLLEIRESWIISFVENVHFRISLCEMPKMPRHDAKKRLKKFASHFVP